LSPLYRLVVLTAVNHLRFASVRLAVSLYAVHLQASMATVGVLMAIFGLLSALTSVGAGRWVDRIGPKKPMLWASAAMVAGAALAFVWRDLAALYVVSAVVGTLFNVFFIAYQPLLGRYGRSEDRIRNFSVGSTALSVSTFIAPLVTGFSIDHIGYAETFLLLSLLPLIPIAVIAMNKLPFPPVAPRPPAVAEGAPQGGVLQLLRNRELRRIYAYALIANVTWNLFSFLMPLYCLQLRLNASSIGLVLGSYAVASIVSRATALPLSRVFAPWQLLIVSGCIAGACFVAFTLVNSFALLAAFSFVLGLGLGVANPMSQSLMYDAAPPSRVGEVMGLRITMGNTMQTIVPLASGAIGATLGMAPIFWALAVTQFSASWAIRHLWRRRAPKAPRD